jgi:cyclic beta-1,2-glucan synthetase
VWSILAWARLGDGDTAAELFSLLNPINHASTRAGVHRYRVEPYVMAADVYAEPPHVGRGGWTWYTGSAGWMYQAGLEAILGVHLKGDAVVLDPCIPRSWPGFEIDLRHGSATYEIRVDNPAGVSRGIVSIEVDGAAHPHDEAIALHDDGATHAVRVVMGPRPPSRRRSPG